MTTPKINWEISVGTIINGVLVLAGMAIGYGQFSAKFEAVSTTVSTTQRDVRQIQHYLSGNDPQYWHKVHDNGDSDK